MLLDLGRRLPRLFGIDRGQPFAGATGEGCEGRELDAEPRPPPQHPLPHVKDAAGGVDDRWAVVGRAIHAGRVGLAQDGGEREARPSGAKGRLGRCGELIERAGVDRLGEAGIQRRQEEAQIARWGGAAEASGRLGAEVVGAQGRREEPDLLVAAGLP